MNFDPDKLIPLGRALAQAGLPALGTILGTALPFPLDLMVGPAFTAIANALGVDPATQDALAAVQRQVEADPGAASAKLQAIDTAHKDAAEAAQAELAVRLRDVESARAQGFELVQAGSALAWGPPIISAIAVAGFFVICGIMLFHVGDQAVAQGILGAMTVGWTTVLTYWCGSSKGSADKTGELASIARAAAGSGVRHR